MSPSILSVFFTSVIYLSIQLFLPENMQLDVNLGLKGLNRKK